MMVSFTRSCKNGWLPSVMRGLLLSMLLAWASLAQAQSSADIPQFRVEVIDDEVVASSSIVFELPQPVEDALLKGVPLFFVTEADIVRERWYWYDRKVTSVRRHTRLAYQPLTRRWRLNVTAGAAREGGVGLVLNQSFDTLEQALATVKRVSYWPVANLSELSSGVKYKVEFRFRLDISQLPLPFQIGTLGQTDWDLSAAATAPLVIAPPK
jgi:hypothetical protein